MLARLAQKAHLVALGGAIIYLIVAQVWLSPSYGWWQDELYSLWVSDPSGPLQRLLFDTNPPLYFFALRLARSVVPDERSAMLAVSALALFSVSALLLTTARTAMRQRCAAIALALFMTSGVTTFFFQEARAFFPAACIGLAASWMVVLLIERKPPRRVGITLALLAAAAAAMHFYAALLTGCLAAGLLAFALFGKRRDLVTPALVLGVSSVVFFGAWFAVAADRTERIGWIVFSMEEVRGALWMVRSFVLGPSWALLLAAPLVVFAALQPRLQPALFAFAVAIALFFSLPILISFKLPIIVGRYWCVGVGLFVTPMALLLDELSTSASRNRMIALGLAALTVLVSIVSGLLIARRFLVAEAVWANAALVRELGRGCGPRTIAVPAYISLYSTASGLPASTFAVSTPAAPVAVGGGCRVVAWAEMVAAEVKEEDLLPRLGWTRPPGDLRIIRTRTGFVALRDEGAN